ncbi:MULTISPECIES: pilus assembly protein TadG-related protein [Pseudomonas]|uniref:Membrane protein n=1 Tax=Pseudomonas umsongensis TaxID=198618 RepID=A0ACC5MHH3_9PSED|nr:MULTISPECIES: pilus assembly protein TadG-related protein [Pseudomonas]MBB2887975.1 putative membrane protein [Pseudomonas umsongensis]NMN79421.1 putative membrane protein [Pseudomonas sp. KD5]
MSPCLQFRSPARQRGAIGLMAVLTLGMALVFLLIVVDSGRLYLEKRSLQRIADMAALEAATRNGDCAVGASATAYATASVNRNGFTLPDPTRSLAVACGTLSLDANSLRVFVANPSSSEAIRVIVSHSVPQSFAGGVGALFGGAPAGATLNLTATAVAALPPPLASLTLRTTALSIDSSKSATLNALFGGLLGGSLNVSVAGWDGLVNTNIRLLGYLDRLKVDLGLNAAGYNQVLGASVAVSQLIQTAVNVLDPGGTLGATATIVGLQALKVAAGSTTVVLGNLLHVENGSDVSTFATTVSVFNLIEGVVQLANKKNGVVATVPINLVGLAQITARVQVLEPPQLSAIGNPKNAALDPLGPNRIYVKTAQLRTLLSIDLPALDAIAALVNAAADLAGPLTNTLNALLNLDLVAVLNSLTCAIGVPCQTPDVIVLPGPIRLDVALDVASADSYVTAYSCISNTNKTLTTNTSASLVNLKIGRIDAASMFGSNTAPPTVTVQPLKLIDIGIKTCRRFLFVPITCDPRVPGVGGGIDVVADTSVAANTNMPHVYSAPPANSLPDINQPPFYYSFSTSSIVSNLLNTPVNLHVDMYGPSGSLVGGLGAILNSVTSLLVSAINGVLNPLLDSLINTVLISLGVDLNKVDVGANLSCHSGRASLVI